MINARMKMAAGAMACDKVLEREAIERNNIDMVHVHVNVNKRKMKKFSGVLRRFDIKYTTKSKIRVTPTLFGKSAIIDADQVNTLEFSKFKQG
jgi:hypothetical protein